MLKQVDSWERKSTTEELWHMLRTFETFMLRVPDHPEGAMDELHRDNVIACWYLVYDELCRRNAL